LGVDGMQIIPLVPSINSHDSKIHGIGLADSLIDAMAFDQI